MNAFIIEGKFKKNKASQASQQTTQDKNIERLPQVEIYNISPKGKLADIYNLGSKYTDIQRDNMEKELKGKIVRWELPVYEVSKISDKKYKISTGTGNPFKESYVSTVIEISVKDSKEAEYIESLMTDNMINIQGKITGVSLRRIMIKEASLY
jgi:carbamoylphosphate synthase small subunit